MSRAPGALGSLSALLFVIGACAGGPPGGSAGSSESSTSSSAATSEGGTSGTTSGSTASSSGSSSGEATTIASTSGGEGTTTGDEGTTTGGETTGGGATVSEACLEDQEPGGAWSRRITDANLGSLGQPLLAVDPGGAVLVSARFRGPINLGGGPLDVDGVHYRQFIAKYEGACELAWGLAIGGDEGQIVDFALGVDAAGDVLVAGTFSGTIDVAGASLEATFGIDAIADILELTTDLFVAKLSADGELLWARRFGDDAYQRAHGVAATASGGLVVVGGVRGTVDLGGEVIVADDRYDGLLAEFDAEGELVWAKAFSATAGVGFFAVEVGAEGRISIGGAGGSGVDLGGGPLAVEGEAYELFGQFEPSGEHRWSRRIPTGLVPTPGVLAVDEAGAVYVTGRTKAAMGEPIDAFLIKLAAEDGALAWTRLGEAVQSATGLDVAIDAAGDVEIVGTFGDGVDFGGGLLVVPPANIIDTFIARFTSEGELVSSVQISGEALSRVTGSALVFGPGGERVLAGEFSGSVDLGEGLLTALGVRDLFVRRAAD